MLTNIFRKLALTTASTVLGLAAISQTSPAQAAIFKYNFTVDASDSVQGTGSFSFDDTAPRQITAFGDALSVSDLQFSWLGTTYSAADDVRYSLTPDLVPSIYVQQGTSNFLGALDYAVDTPTVQFAFIPFTNGVEGSTSFSAISLPDNSFKTGTVKFTPVPEPSSVLGTLVLGALGAGAILKRQHKSANH